MKHTKLKVILFVITQVLQGAIKKHASVRKHVNGRSCGV